MIKSLDLVHRDVVPLFEDSARFLIEEKGAEKALAMALAFVNHYYRVRDS